MQKPLHLIYITGLGDHNVDNQRRAVDTWRWYGVESEVFQVLWADREPWQPKFDRLLARIDDLNAQGKDVGLVGVSAGATAVINAYAARKGVLVGVVLIAGKVNRPAAIGGRFRSDNPAFITSALNCQDALVTLTAEDRRRILSRFGIIDEVVPFKDSIITGARNRVSLTIGHTPTIGLQISFGAWSFIHFLKRQAAARAE
ncbi:MAG: hypothetical protein JWO35_563 [Candidatus Saccharibacteria bacterium]|nr:hypothetical protein [Candidatus Saccharibacteria bacterium]